MLPSKNLFYSRFGAENLSFVTSLIYVSGTELCKCLRCGLFIPQKVNCWRRKELINFFKRVWAWPFNEKLEITICFTWTKNGANFKLKKKQPYHKTPEKQNPSVLTWTLPVVSVLKLAWPVLKLMKLMNCLSALELMKNMYWMAWGNLTFAPDQFSFPHTFSFHKGEWRDAAIWSGLCSTLKLVGNSAL